MGTFWAMARRGVEVTGAGEEEGAVAVAEEGAGAGEGVEGIECFV